ncbi:MAG: hypothetical protein H7Y18_17730 [Clostridiaceae bacterium]|nr:hypothetical protein [Clostridiaceae bacterium]
MCKRSMAITEPDKTVNIEEKNPENKKIQSVQEENYLDSAVKHNKGGAKKR